MLKRIISLLLALSICIIPVYADETTAPEVVLSAEREAAVVTEAYSSSYGLISAIAPEITDDLVAGVVTRGDFVTKLMKLLKVEPISPITHYFADVDISSANSPYIHTAAELGWISKAYTFEPDSVVQLDQAYKMIVSALGYNVAALANGGWPAGYTKMAKDMEISDGITTSGDIDDANMMILFGNILEVGYTEDKIITYNKDLPNNYLNVIYDTYKVEGMVNATRYNSTMYSADVRSDGYMEINGDVYTYDTSKEDTPIYSMLGYDVNAYYEMNGVNKKIVYTEITKDNKVTRFEHADYINASNGEISYEDEIGNVREYKLDGACTMVYNGRTLEEVDDAKFNLPGFSNLLDNDGDRDIDFVHVTGYTYMEVAYVDSYNGGIGDRKDAANALDLHLNLEENTLWIKNSDGTDSELSKIASNTVLQVAKSDDGKLVSLEILPTMSGTVEQKTTDGTYIIAGNEYKMSDYFETHYGNIIAPGAQMTYAIGYGNILAAITETQNTGFNYAYVLDFKTEKLFDKTLKLRVVDTTGNINVYTTGEKITLDGEKATVDDCVAALSDADGNAINQVIKIALNATGELAKIDTPVDFDNDHYEEQIENDEDCLVHFPSLHRDMKYRAYSNVFSGHINGVGTKLLFMPEELTDDSDDYRCVQMGSGEFTDGVTYKPWVYDLNVDTASAGLLVFMGQKTTLGWENAYFVDSVYETTDEEGNIITGFSAWKEGTWYNLTIDKEVSYVRTGNPTIQPGDFVRVRLDGNNVTELLVDFNSDTMTYNATLSSSNYEQPQANPNYTVGVPYTGGNGMIRIITPRPDGKWERSLDVLRGISTTNAKVLKFNYKTKQSRPSSVNELKTIKNYGIKEADFIVVLQQYERTKMIILIEDYDKN